MRELIIRLYNSFTLLNPDNLTLVKYNPKVGLSFHQLGVDIQVPFVNHLYHPKKFKLGVLVPGDFQMMMKTLLELMESNIFDNPTMTITPKKLGFSINRTFPYENMIGIGPVSVYKIEFVSTTNLFLIKVLGLIHKNFGLLLLSDKNIKKNERSRSKDRK